MLHEYRRRSESDTWHFATNCKQWPTEEPTESEAHPEGKRPTTGELCNQCLSLERRGDAEFEVPINVEGGKQVDFTPRKRSRKSPRKRKR